VIFAQLFEPVSSTYTYLLGCEETGLAVLIDPVMPAWQRDLAEVRSRGLTLAYTVDTHIHADHITSALQLRREAGSRIANAAADGLPCFAPRRRTHRRGVRGDHGRARPALPGLHRSCRSR
jgi:glyoxylase-like metal-dependent hydrolase (beta-lactamase superfamily II)